MDAVSYHSVSKDAKMSITTAKTVTYTWVFTDVYEVKDGKMFNALAMRIEIRHMQDV